MTIKIREAYRSEASVIADFQMKMALETEDVELDAAVVERGVNAIFSDEHKGVYYVGLVEDEIVGSLLTTYEWSDWRCSTVWWIQSVFIKNEFRGKGVFKKMYAHLKGIVENSPDLAGLRLYVDKSNVKAQKVYESIGMNGDHYFFYEWMK
ncbi:MAG: GNAT family N-acetyltransferase [Bacteroidota bacterium]